MTQKDAKDPRANSGMGKVDRGQIKPEPETGAPHAASGSAPAPGTGNTSSLGEAASLGGGIGAGAPAQSPLGTPCRVLQCRAPGRCADSRLSRRRRSRRPILRLAQEKVGIFGQVVWLLMQSPAHKHLFLADIEWLVLPAIQLNQFRLWQNMGMPQAYATWAFLDEAGEARIRQNIKKLGPADWKSGEALWLIDMVAPFGGLDQALKDLRNNVSPGKRMKMLQAAPGGGVAVTEW